MSRLVPVGVLVDLSFTFLVKDGFYVLFALRTKAVS
jgi:hypothetical protein